MKAKPIPRPKAEPQTAERAVLRSLGYELLARAFAYPDTLAIAELRECAATAGPLLAGTPLAGLALAASRAEAGDLLDAHLDLFTVSSSPDCPTFESAFVCEQPQQQTAVMADVAGFYRAFGVEVAGDGLRPDDIRAELDFMSYLARKQAYAIEHLGAPRQAQAARAERMFLGEHLGSWGTGLGMRLVARATPGSFYWTLGQALHLWLSEEAGGLGMTPFAPLRQPVMDFSRPQPEPEDLAEVPDVSSPLISIEEIGVS